MSRPPIVMDFRYQLLCAAAEEESSRTEHPSHAEGSISALIDGERAAADRRRDSRSQMETA